MVLHKLIKDSELKLLKNEVAPFTKEQRILPRFPLHYLTFRGEVKNKSVFHRAFEIKDISTHGMQIEQKIGHAEFDKGDALEGQINWYGHKIDVNAVVIWTKGQRCGVKFHLATSAREKLETFLSLDRMTKFLKPLPCHLPDFPQGLKYWLRSEGPLELLVWEEQRSPVHCLWIYLNLFVEWSSREGIKTGKIYRQREHDEIEVKLIESQFTLLHDHTIDRVKLQAIQQFFKIFPEGLIDEEDQKMIQTKFAA